jgi:hypothetical protein
MLWNGNECKTKVIISKEPSQLQILIDQKQLKNVEHFKYLGSMITNDARCIREIVVNPGLPRQKQYSTERRLFFTSKLHLNLRKNLVKCYIKSTALYGAETWTFRRGDQKHLDTFEMWCLRRHYVIYSVNIPRF